MTSTERTSGFAAVVVMLLFTFGVFPLASGLFPRIASKRVRDVISVSGFALMTIWLFVLFRLILPRLVLTMGEVGLVVLWGFEVPVVAVTVILFGNLIAARKRTMMASS